MAPIIGAMRTPVGTVSQRLAAIAPRLAVAHAAADLDATRRRIAREVARERLERKRWLVAHRELELIRQAAGVRYGQQPRKRRRATDRAIRQRARKLDEARLELIDAENHARTLGAWYPA